MNVIPFPGTDRCCNGQAGHATGRLLNLAVAPRANARVRFSEATKAPPAITPQEGLALLDRLFAQGERIGVVNISGPGDPLAWPGPVFETLRLVREKYPDLHICLTTLGIGGDRYAVELKQAGVAEVNLLVDAVTSEVAENLYAWIRPGTRTVSLQEAVRVLLAEQEGAIAAFERAGCVVKISTTVYPGCNDDQVEEIARQAARLGAASMALAPSKSLTDDSGSAAKVRDLMTALCRLAAKHIKIVELTGEHDRCDSANCPAGEIVEHYSLPKPDRGRPNVAVVSTGGMEVDLHLGQADRILIYGPREDGLPCLLATRQAPPSGGGGARWEKLADILDDCFALLAAGAGENPRKILAGHGITVLVTDGDIAGSVDVLYGGGRKRKK